MISVILSILKIILIILACIIGLLLFLISLVLFVPIRYEVSGKLDNDIVAKGRVSWLLRIFSLRISYIEEMLKFKITIFGLSIFDSDKPKDAKKDIRKEQGKTKHKKQRAKIGKVKDSIDSKVNDEPEQKDEKALKKRLDKPLGKKSKTTKKPSIKAVISETLKSIKNIIIKIFRTIISILIMIYNLLLRIEPDEESTKSNFSKVKTFLKENKPGIKVMLKAVKALLNHIKPTKFEGYIEFGMDDPSQTGQILGLVSIFHGSYYKSLRIIPNFEERILKGTIFLKGRIRLFTILIIAVKLILNKSFQLLWNNFKVLKEEL